MNENQACVAPVDLMPVQIVRCKMKLAEIHNVYWSSAKKYVFQCEYDQTIPEDQRFFKSSPTGRFEIMVDNPNVNYVIGAYYYFDSQPVPIVPAS